MPSCEVSAAEAGRGFCRPDAPRHPLHVAAGHRISWLLYGGTIDAEGTRRVQVSAGRITAYLRDEWGLERHTGRRREDEKNRGDHRHHAVDAAVIALTNAGTVEMLSRSAELAAERGHRLFVQEEIEKPWPTFLDDVRRSIDAIKSPTASTAASRAHCTKKQTTASRTSFAIKTARQVEYRHVRKPLQNMTAKEVENIVDDTIRKLVQAKLEQIGGEPKKVFADPGQSSVSDGQRWPTHLHPQSPHPQGRGGDSARQIGLAAICRSWQQPSHGDFAVLDKDGKRKRWEAEQ